MDDPIQDKNIWGWQATATSMKERTTYLWKNNPIPFNVTFEVGPGGQKESIGAHRDILSISSEVFCSMFYGPIAKSKGQKKSIVDDDIDPVAFRLMLRFIYTESIEYDDKLNCRIEPFPAGVELAFKTMQAAGKYGIPALYLFCRDYIVRDIQETFRTSQNVAKYGILYGLYARNAEWANSAILEAVWREIDAFTGAVLKAPDQVLKAVDETFVVDFLSRTTLNISREIMLYDFAVRWARLQREGSPMNGNLSSMMEKVVKVLRFSSMSEQEWLDGPVKDGLYTLDDLKYKVAVADGVTSRCAHDPPAIITFDMTELKKRHPEDTDSQQFQREIVGQIRIQTQTESNHELTKLIEKCVRNKMKPSVYKIDRSKAMSLNFLYKWNQLDCYGLHQDYRFELNTEEEDMLRKGSRVAAQMKLGLGEVAVAFHVKSEYVSYRERTVYSLEKMFLVFGDDGGKESWQEHWRDGTGTSLFYLGRLTSGQDYLDNLDHNPNKKTASYEVRYEKKTLDAPAEDEALID